MENQDQKADAQAVAGKAVLKAGRAGIIGIKAGMTQVYNESGEVRAVTVIDLQPNIITQVKTAAKEGYAAIQVGLLEKKAKNATKAEQGHAKKVSKPGFKHYQEFRMPDDSALAGLEVGQILSAEFIKAGDLVDLSSVSKGKQRQRFPGRDEALSVFRRSQVARRLGEPSSDRFHR
jgi:hypothetical protein